MSRSKLFPLLQLYITLQQLDLLTEDERTLLKIYLQAREESRKRQYKDLAMLMFKSKEIIEELMKSIYKKMHLDITSEDAEFDLIHKVKTAWLDYIKQIELMR